MDTDKILISKQCDGAVCCNKILDGQPWTQGGCGNVLWLHVDLEDGEIYFRCHECNTKYTFDDVLKNVLYIIMNKISWSDTLKSIGVIKIPKGSTFVTFFPEDDRLFFICEFKKKYEIYEIKEKQKGKFKKVKFAVIKK